MFPLNFWDQQFKQLMPQKICLNIMPRMTTQERACYRYFSTIISLDYSIKSIIHGPSLHETIQVLKNCRGLKYALIVLGFEEFVSQSHEKDNGILSRKNGLPIQPFPTLLLVVLEVPFLVQNSLTVLLETNICRLSSHTTKKAALNNSEYAAPCLPVTVFPAQLELQVSHLLKRTICTQLFSVTVLYTEQH